MKNKRLQLILMVMKYTFTGMLLQCLTLQLLFASDIWAQQNQSVRDVKINWRIQQAGIIDIFQAIEEKTSFKFSYEQNDIDRNSVIAVPSRNTSVADVLIEISRQANLKFRQVNNVITVIKMPAPKNFNSAEALEILIQTRNVSGKVTSFEDGEPLPGVNVIEKGTSNGTVTNLQGAYNLTVNEGATLVFSSVGYTTEEVAIGTRSVVDLAMNQDIQQLQELVVVAYGTQDRRELTSSISSIKAKELGTIPVASADALLQGKAAGVQVVQNSGQPGGEVFVRIRGTSSLLGESRPLYVIDGVPMTNIDRQPLGGGGQRFSALADINPNDIESIEILKDAAAAALYGARGSNGVVLITTKKGQTGEARINFDAYYGSQNVYKTFDLLGGQEYIDMVNEGQVNSGNAPFSELTFTGEETDWQNEVFRTAPISSYNLSVSGGNEKLTSFVSLGYFDQSGTLIGQEFNRLNGRLNLDYKANDWLKIGTNTTFSSSVTDRVDADLSSFSVLGNALFFNPNVPVRNEDGSWGSDPTQSGELENPVMIANELTHDIKSRRVISNVYGEIQFLKNFKLRSTFGIDYLTRREERFIPSYFLRLNPRGNAAAAASFYDEMIWQNENTLQYGNQVGKHSFGGLIGMSMLESEASFFGINGITTASDLITTFSASDIRPPNHNISNWGLLSYFGRVNYTYDGKYIIEASIRRDGSSRFGSENRFGTFPSISAAYRISEEPFMAPLQKVISDLKLRVSHGSTGNQDGIDNFGSLTQYSAGAFYNGRPAIFKSSVGNVDLRWENTVSTNLGLDVGLLNNRIELILDAYVRVTNDLFYPLALPRTTGFGEIRRVNLGSLENRGVEMMLTTYNLTGDFSWNTSFNIAFNRNKITDLLEFNGISDRVIGPIDIGDAEGPYGLFRIGEPTGNFYGYKWLGIWGSPEYPEIPGEWNPNPDNPRVRPGDVVFEDVNENFAYGRIDDHQLIGNALPLHTGGITNNFAYKGLDLNIVMNWSYGNDIYNMSRAVMESMASLRNQLATTADRWSPNNINSTIPRAFQGANSASGAANNDANSSFVEDGSFLRVRNVTLGYNLPQALTDKIALSNARIYVSAQNLFTFTNYSGLDPENQNLGASQGGIPSLGVDFLTQPQPRVFMLGVNVGL